MSQHEKLIKRLINKPVDFTWSELKSLLAGFGYTQVPAGKTAESRRRFLHKERGPIILHQPHPRDELRAYQVTQLVTFLRAEGLIK